MSLYLSDKTRSVSWTQGDGSERAKHFPQRPSSNREAAAAKLQLLFWTCTTLCVEWRIQCNLLHDHAAVLKIFENLLNSLAQLVSVARILSDAKDASLCAWCLGKHRKLLACEVPTKNKACLTNCWWGTLKINVLKCNKNLYTSRDSGDRWQMIRTEAYISPQVDRKRFESRYV